MLRICKIRQEVVHYALSSRRLTTLFFMFVNTSLAKEPIFRRPLRGLPGATAPSSGARANSTDLGDEGGGACALGLGNAVSSA